ADVAVHFAGIDDGAIGAQNVFRDPEQHVAEAGVPGEQQFFGMLHIDAHGVGDFAAVLPQINSAHGGYGRRYSQVQHLVPDGQLVAHVFVEVAAGIVPEEPPVDVTVGIEVVRRRLSQE